ncbi:MAG TPA: nuclear transport factor 2 family protein [bacterium]
MNLSFEQLFAAIDRKDADGFVAFLTDDAIFRYGSPPAIQGQENVRVYVAGFFQSIKALSHKVSAVYDSGDALFYQGEVSYTLQDNRQISLPFLNLFKMRGGKITEYLVYIDPSPLMAE